MLGKDKFVMKMLFQGVGITPLLFDSTKMKWEAQMVWPKCVDIHRCAINIQLFLLSDLL